jgi:peptide/nickel transport system permease protein
MTGGMIKYTLQRFAQSLIVILAVVTVVFLLVRLSGNPARVIAPLGATHADIVAISNRLGLQNPLYVQYLTFLSQLVRGDFGTSYGFQTSVGQLLTTALPYTAELAVVAFAFASIVGVSLGTIAAVKSGTWVDGVARFIGLIGQSVPVFWLGIVFVLVFSVKLRLLPSFGAGSPDHLILPALALSLRPMASITRLSRSATLEALRADYTLFERSKGVKQSVLMRHLLRNMSLPVITLTGIQLADLLSGSVVIETLFGWPGMGLLAIQAINLRDYTVVQGVVTVDTIIVVLMNLLVDLSYGWLDPRVRRRVFA